MPPAANPFADEPGAAAAPVSAPPPVAIRPLETHAEYLACVELQKETWGADFAECVPPSILKVSQRIGGVAAGAFDPEGRLLGFVFGISGVEGGRTVHWSDMLAVRQELRNLGLGRRLKEYQREYLRALGVEVIYWTFDPLVARNAHLNLNSLGVEVIEYVRDFYGDTGSELHNGLGTDRLVVAWPIGAGEGSAAGRPSAPSPQRAAETPVVNVAPGESAGQPSAEAALEGGGMVRIQIPLDIYAIKEQSHREAAAWRRSTRRAFLSLLPRGYRVAGFYRDDRAERGYYLLRREEPMEGGV